MEYLQRSGRIRGKFGIVLLLIDPWAVAPPLIWEKWGLGEGNGKLMKRDRTERCILDYANLEGDSLDALWCHGEANNNYNGLGEVRSEYSL